MPVPPEKVPPQKERGDRTRAGWGPDDWRYVEAGPLRVSEHAEGAFVNLVHGQTSLSSSEILFLARAIAGWFGDDARDVLQILNCATYVREELEAWNARARSDEEHPPYDALVRAIDGLLSHARDLSARIAGHGSRQRQQQPALKERS